jgi:hemin uptake protein HemP
MSEDIKAGPNLQRVGPDAREPDSRRTRVSSKQLLGGSRELIIEHAGDEYRLRLTSQGKLILTK